MSSGLWQPSPLFTRISDSEQALKGSGDPSIAVDYGFIIFFFSWGLGGGILDFACHKIFLPGFRFENNILTEDLGDKS